MKRVSSSVYCIVKCPFCNNVQGGQYPVKRTTCNLCSKTVDLEKIGPLGTYGSLKEMQAVLIAMKWEGDESPVHEVNEPDSADRSVKKVFKGRDGLRRYLLDIIADESSRDIVIKRAITEGYDIGIIEDVIDELIEHGLVTSPRYRILKKA